MPKPLFRTVNGVPNRKVSSATAGAIVGGALFKLLAVYVPEVRQLFPEGSEEWLGDLIVSGVGAFISGYVMPPGPNDGVVSDSP